jgi:hypothetical protein
LGQRSRKRRPTIANAAGGTSADRKTERGYARSRERNEAIRAKLEPYGEGERPLVVTICAIIAGLIAVANLVLYLAGWEVRGQDPNLGGALALCVVLAAAAVGLWRMRYWAVLGFEMLLGVLAISALLSLLVASNWRAALLAVAIVAIVAPLFWMLIRVMARIQLPERKRN